jgi:hypothetical protein
MNFFIVRTPQDDDNSLPELLARSGAPASGRAQGAGARKSMSFRAPARQMLLAFAGIGAVGTARIVAMAIVIVLTTIASVTGTRAVIAGAAGVAIVRAVIVGTAILIVAAVSRVRIVDVAGIVAVAVVAGLLTIAVIVGTASAAVVRPAIIGTTILIVAAASRVRIVDVAGIVAVAVIIIGYCPAVPRRRVATCSWWLCPLIACVILDVRSLSGQTSGKRRYRYDPAVVRKDCQWPLAGEVCGEPGGAAVSAAAVNLRSHRVIFELFRLRRKGRRHGGHKTERGGQAKRCKAERGAANHDKPRRVTFAAIYTASGRNLLNFRDRIARNSQFYEIVREIFTANLI